VLHRDAARHPRHRPLHLRGGRESRLRRHPRGDRDRVGGVRADEPAGGTDVCVDRPASPARRVGAGVTTQIAEAAPEAPEEAGYSPSRQLWVRLRRKRIAMVALVVIAIIYGAGLFANVLAPYSYSAQNLDRGLEGP